MANPLQEKPAARAGDMGTAEEAGRGGSTLRPLTHRNFREIWLGSLFSNLGLLILGVGAAWAMTSLSSRAEDVALVQSALMLPFLFLALPAGAIADSHDRRKIAMAALGGAVLCTSVLTVIAVAGRLTPGILLLFCFLTGCANAIFAPAWQSSVPEQVPKEDVSEAVALNSISFNIARSFGPAVGGVIVAAAGAAAAFGATALLYFPVLMAFFRWRRVPDEPRLPPERVVWATVSGIRYIFYSAAMRAVILRSFLYCVAGASIVALLPLLSKQQLGGSALTFGILLASFGVGAVIGAVALKRIRSILTDRWHAEVAAAIVGACVIGLSLSHSVLVSTAILLVTGIAWTQLLTSLNIAVQVGAPRWVAGRSLATFQATAAGGFAIGSAIWGSVVGLLGLGNALAISGGVLLFLAVAGRFVQGAHDLPDPTDALYELAEPDVGLALTGRSGPIVIEIEYRIAEEQARDFYGLMLQASGIRRRNGGYGWSLGRDIGDPIRWIERYHCPTWHDYLRQRTRLTTAEAALLQQIRAMILGQSTPRITRILDRPVGSVRWHENTPDRGVEPLSPRLP